MRIARARQEIPHPVLDLIPREPVSRPLVDVVSGPVGNEKLFAYGDIGDTAKALVKRDLVATVERECADSVFNADTRNSTRILMTQYFVVFDLTGSLEHGVQVPR